MVWLLILAALAVSVSGELPPPEGSYKILMLLPVSTQSHRNTFVPLAKALADRGHKVVMLTNNKKEKLVTDNIYEFTHGIEELNIEKYNLFNMKGGPRANLPNFKDLVGICTEKLYAHGEINELYRKKKMFDVIIIDAIMNEVMLPFAHEMPFISLSTAGLESRPSAKLGNVWSPSYVPFMHSTLVHPMNLIERIMNVGYELGFTFYWDFWIYMPLLQEKLSIKFPQLPPLSEIESNVSLILSNSHFSMGVAKPLLPSQVEIGGMHCRPPQSVPQDLEEWIEGSGEAGVIYFSLGSFIRGTSMPEKFRNIILETFGRLKQRVIWKYEEDLPNVPSNVLIRSWLPQQDILGHPKVKVFMTHGGLLSYQEAVYHATPLVILPVSMDQPKNARQAVDNGIGISIPWADVTSADQVVDALLTVLQDSKYQENMEDMSSSFRDQLTTPLDKAVYWTEYVIRHQGAPTLRSPAARLTWIEFLLLDVIVVLIVALVVFVFILKTIFSRFFRFMRTKFGDRVDLSLPTLSKEKMN